MNPDLFGGDLRLNEDDRRILAHLVEDEWRKLPKDFADLSAPLWWCGYIEMRTTGKRWEYRLSPKGARVKEERIAP